MTDPDDRKTWVFSAVHGPSLLVIARDRPTADAVARFRQAWEAHWRGDRTGSVPLSILCDAGVEVHQLIDGKWTELGT